MLVRDYMSTPVIVVSPRDTLAHARNLMIRYGVGRLVVVDEERRPVGVLTRFDLARVVAEEPERPLDSILVEEAMTRNPVVVGEDAQLVEAAKLMVERGVSGLPVVDSEGRLVGIITKTDVTKACTELLRGVEAGRYAYTDFPTVTPSHSIAYVAELIERHPSRRVLVVDAGRLVGIIAPSDIAFSVVVPRRAARRREVRVAAEVRGKPSVIRVAGYTTAGDVMTVNPITASPSDDLSLIASLMLRFGISSVPLVDSAGAPVGLVTKHSLLRALVERCGWKP